MLIPTKQPTIHTLDYARNVIKKLQEDEQDGWSYQVLHIEGRPGNYARILVYDENNEFLGYL